MEDNLTKQEVGRKNGTYAIPAAIVIAGMLIAGALYMTNNKQVETETAAEHTPVLVPALSEDDHILGNPDAQIVVIEYSDFECPFCKNFHATMHQLIDEYGAAGQVAWVYRHFPIKELHSKAAKEAEASECAAELGGNKGFWDFADRLFEITPSNNGLDQKQLPIIAAEVGLDKTDFETCLNSGRYAEKVASQLNDVRTAGGRGTPHNVIIVGEQQAVIEGAQPIDTLRRVINTLLGSSSEQGVPVVPTF